MKKEKTIKEIGWNKFGLITKWAKMKEVYDKSQKIYDAFYEPKYPIQGSNYSAKRYYNEFVKDNKLARFYNIFVSNNAENY